MSDKLPTYEDFVNKYGKRPADIVFAVTQKDTRELTLKEVGEWLDNLDGIDYGNAPDEPMRGYVSLDIRKDEIEALKRGEMPK